jgi:hypothetical protein
MVSGMTRTKRLRKLREELKRLYAAGTSAEDVFKRLQKEAALTPDELEELRVYCEDLYGIGPDTYKVMLGEARYAKVMALYDQEWRAKHGGEAKGGRTDMTMSKEAMEMFDKTVKEMDEDATDNTPWKRGMRKFHRQTRKGGGAFEVMIVRPEHKLKLLLAGEGRCLEVIDNWLEVLRSGQQRPLCLACDHGFIAPEQPFAFCLSFPFYEDATTAIATGICEKCSEKGDAELIEIAYQGFKEFGLANRRLEHGTA